MVCQNSRGGLRIKILNGLFKCSEVMEGGLCAEQQGDSLMHLYATSVLTLKNGSFSVRKLKSKGCAQWFGF